MAKANRSKKPVSKAKSASPAQVRAARITAFAAIVAAVIGAVALFVAHEFGDRKVDAQETRGSDRKHSEPTVTRKAPEVDAEAEDLTNRAEVERRARSFRKAADLLRQAGRLWEQAGEPDKVQRTRLALADVLQRDGKHEEARAVLAGKSFGY